MPTHSPREREAVSALVLISGAARRTAEQHDAFTIVAWLAMADRDGSLATFLQLRLIAPDRTVAQVERWILGVVGALDSFKEATMIEGRGGEDPLH